MRIKQLLTMILAAPQEGLKDLEAHRVIVDREDPHADRELIPLPPHRHPLLLHPCNRSTQKHPNFRRIDAGTRHPSPRTIFCALAPEISGLKIVRSKKPDAEFCKIEPTPGGWEPNAGQEQGGGKPHQRRLISWCPKKVSAPNKLKRKGCGNARKKKGCGNEKRKPESQQQLLPKPHLELKKGASWFVDGGKGDFNNEHTAPKSLPRRRGGGKQKTAKGQGEKKRPSRWPRTHARAEERAPLSSHNTGNGQSTPNRCSNSRRW
jgi:hypothetical protein